MGQQPAGEDQHRHHRFGRGLRSQGGRHLGHLSEALGVSAQLFGHQQPARMAEADAIVVIGLGRFGSALALELMASGSEVASARTVAPKSTPDNPS